MRFQRFCVGRVVLQLLSLDIVRNSFAVKMRLSDEELTQKIDFLFSMSQKMVEAARHDEWEVVVEIEVQRDAVLKLLSGNLVESYLASSLLDLWRQTIISVINSDKEVVMLAGLQKERVAQGASDLESSRKAVNAYLDVSAS